MKKAFAPFIIALVVFLVIELTLNLPPVARYFDAAISDFLAVKTEQLRHDNPETLDVLFLGTSRTGAGFHTQLFEHLSPKPINAFNLGIQDSDYYFFKLILERHIQQYGKPKLVLIEATDFLLNRDRFSQQEVVYFKKLISDNPSLLWELFNTSTLRAADKKEIGLALLSAVYRYRSLLALNGKLAETILHAGNTPQPNPIEEGWEKTSNNPQMYTEKGRLSLARFRVQTLFEDFDAIDTIKLEALLNYCAQKNIHVALVRWPVSPHYHKVAQAVSISEQAYAQFVQLAQKRNMPYIDLTMLPIKNNSAWYADADHLNPTGANVYTQQLLQVVQTRILK